MEQHRNVVFLTKLQEHFVLLPVDKAFKNVCFICKQCYMQTLQHEIINSGNFALVSNEEGEITRELKVYFQNYKLFDPANDKLPFLYWTHLPLSKGLDTPILGSWNLSPLHYDVLSL